MQMVGFDNDAHAEWIEHPHDRVRNVVRHALLHLEPAREEVHDPRNLRQPDDLAVGQVRYVRLAEEWQQVVLAQRVDLDVPHQHHALVPFLEHGAGDHILHGRGIPPGEPLERLVHPPRRVAESLALHILAQDLEHLPHQRRQGRGPRIGPLEAPGREVECVLRLLSFVRWFRHACRVPGPRSSVKRRRRNEDRRHTRTCTGGGMHRT